MIQSESISPSRMAAGLAQLDLSDACEESIERRIRRIENDPSLTAQLCVHPFARQRLLFGKPKELHLIIDPTTQDDRIVKLTVGVWYRGRCLPLCWSIWQGNRPLKDQHFWDEVEKLLFQAKGILPKHVEVVFLGDRAFGTPAFTDLVEAQGWHFLVRIQGQTRVLHPSLDPQGEAVNTLVCRAERKKLKAKGFKKRGWRKGSVVVYWGEEYDDPLCLFSSLPATFGLVLMYKRRYLIETTFRDYKSKGFHFEQGQVTDQDHLKVLLVGMALSTWLCILTGVKVARDYLSGAPKTRRSTLPRIGQRSLFYLGLKAFGRYLITSEPVQLNWGLDEWDAPCWHQQVLAHHQIKKPLRNPKAA